MAILFGSTVVLCLLPFFFRFPPHKNIHFILVLFRFFLVMGVAQVLRSITFSVTLLPSPAPHCRPGSKTYDPPKTALEVWFRQDYETGCGDLIFSSHVNFLTTLTFFIFYYLFPSSGERKIMNQLRKLKKKGFELEHLTLPELEPDLDLKRSSKCFTNRMEIDKNEIYNSTLTYLWNLPPAWRPEWWFPMFCAGLDIFSALLIIAFRKHYSVDVVTSLYITILINFAFAQYYSGPVRVHWDKVEERLKLIEQAEDKL